MGEVCVGISFGTAFCCIAVSSDDTPHVIPDSQGYRSTPSYIAFTAAGVLIGRTARDQLSCNSLNTVHSFKPLLGRKFSDLVTTLNFTQLPYQVIPAPGDTALIVVTNEGKEQRFSPIDICALIFSHLKAVAESYLGTSVSKAVLSVPPYFGDSQRQAVKDAGTLAGLNVLRIINEPTATCLAYQLDKTNSKQEIPVIVVDLGAGGATITLQSIEDGIFEVKDVIHDREISGEEIDERLTEYCAGQLKKNAKFGKSEIDLRTLRLECENAKCRLSSQTQVTVLAVPISRSLFDRLNQDLYTRCSALIARVLSSARLSRNDIQHVVLAGGGARIPAFQRLLATMFPACEICRNIVPEEIVAYGAAIQAGVLTKPCPMSDCYFFMDICSLSLGVEIPGGILHPIILRNTIIPCRKTALFTTVVDYQDTVEINVYEGERVFTRDNNYLTTFRLAGLLPRPKGLLDIEITCEIDVNGVIYVTATETVSCITARGMCSNDSGRLSAVQIEEMINSARFNAAKDALEKQVLAFSGSIETGNMAIRPKVQLSIANSPFN